MYKFNNLFENRNVILKTCKDRIKFKIKLPTHRSDTRAYVLTIPESLIIYKNNSPSESLAPKSWLLDSLWLQLAPRILKVRTPALYDLMLN